MQPTPPNALDRNLGWMDRAVEKHARRRVFSHLPALLPDSPMDRMLRHLAHFQAAAASPPH